MRGVQDQLPDPVDVPRRFAEGRQPLCRQLGGRRFVVLAAWIIDRVVEPERNYQKTWVGCFCNVLIQLSETVREMGGVVVRAARFGVSLEQFVACGRGGVVPRSFAGKQKP